VTRSRARLTPGRMMLVASALLAGCGGAGSDRPAPTDDARIGVVRAPGGNIVRGCVTAYDSTVDYFPEKSVPAVAEQFTIAYHRHYKVITVTPRRDTTLRLSYTLVQCGTPTPPRLDPRRVFQIPIDRLAVTHPDYYGVVDTLGLLDRLVALGPVQRLWHARLREALRTGRVREVGSQQHLDMEALIALRPDVILSYWSAVPEFNAPAKLDEVGIRGAALLGHWERHPIGGLEWVEVVAAFANAEGRANDLVRGIRARYDSLRQAVATVPPRLVMHGVPQRDRWGLIRLDYAFHRLLQDARLRYAFADLVDGAAFPQTTFEAVLPAARRATLWVGANGAWESVADITASDARLGALPAVQAGEVYTLDARRDSEGRFPYPEQWLFRPDLYLADLIAAGHPDRMPGHAFAFMRRVGGESTRPLPSLAPRGP
jgi:iron complex transport system substrate-binding protein